jgi:hypothetical protein
VFLSPLNEENCSRYGGKMVAKEGKKFCEIPELTPSLIHDLSSELPLTKYGESYLAGISEIPEFYPSQIEYALRTQIPYILGNMELPRIESEKLAKRQLIALQNKELVPLEIIEEEPEKWRMTETELGDIMLSFERVTERKVDRGEILNLEDFERFSKRYSVPLEKVLVATDWSGESLSDEVQALKAEYEKKMRIED